MKTSSVEAIAPATSANLGAGFDVFGVALDVLFDSVYAEKTAEKQIKITIEGVGSNLIPTDPDRNTAGIVAKELLKASRERCGVKLRIKKGVRPGSGLGSSAASAAAAAVALNELLELKIAPKDLISFAAQGEIASAGAPHADNVSAAILGNFIVIRSYSPLDIASLLLPENVEFAIALPDISYTTSIAREVLPKKIDRSDLVYNVGHAAAFMAGIILKDVALMGKAMSDSVIEPARAPLITGLARVKQKAVEAGAAGVTISGSGPSVLALVDSNKTKADKVAKAMKEAFDEHGIQSHTLQAKPGPGARISRREL